MSPTFPINLDLAALAKALQPYLTITPPVVTPPPPSSVSWVYHNGVFVWGQGGGDYSWNTGPIDYADTVGNPGGRCIAVPIIGQWGGWQPYAPGKRFDTSPFKYLIYSTKPTQPNQTHGMGFEAINDVSDGLMLNLGGQYGTAYGPNPTVGQWGSYKIPLADFKLTNPLIQKFSITDGTGNVPNLFYVDNVGFST